MEISERLRRLRKKYGYAQWQVAEYLGLSRESVTHMETDRYAKKGVPVKHLRKLAEFYRVPVLYLMGEMEWLDDVQEWELFEFLANPDNRAWVEMAMELKKSGSTPEEIQGYIDAIRKHKTESDKRLQEK